VKSYSFIYCVTFIQRWRWHKWCGLHGRSEPEWGERSYFGLWLWARGISDPLLSRGALFIPISPPDKSAAHW